MSQGWSAPDFLDAYAVLGVPASADHQQIKAAYRRLAARHHPDVASGDQRVATARMQTINVAYGLVGSPALRARYDRLRRAQQARAAFADADEVWAQLLRAAGRWVGRQSGRGRGGSYRAGYVVGRWLRG